MSKYFHVIKSDDAPEAVGPYVQGLIPKKPGVTATLSGQLGLNPEPEIEKNSPSDIYDQTKRTFANIKAVLTAAGLTYDHVQHIDVYLDDMDDFPKMNEVYAANFEKECPDGHLPTRAAVAVENLPLYKKGTKVEMVTKVFVPLDEMKSSE